MKDRSSSIIPRFLRRGFLLSGFLIVSLGFYHVVGPVGFRRTVFEPAREILFLEKELQPLSHWDRIRRIEIPPSNIITIPATGKNGVNIVADFRVPERTSRAPAILLLHGSSHWGRKNGLIQYLSYRLEKEGWVVLAPDQRGFGDSETPKEVDDLAAWDVKDDIKKCIDYILCNPMVDPNRIYVLGHSMGAGEALGAAIENDKVRGLILIGPPRFLEGTAEDKITVWMRTRFSAVRRLDKPADTHLVAEINKLMDIVEIGKGALSRPGHKPILLVDGEAESGAERIFLGKVASGITSPLDYISLPGTGHYVGAYNLMGSRDVYNRPDLLDPFMKVFNEFTASVDPPRRKKADLLSDSGNRVVFNKSLTSMLHSENVHGVR